MAAAHTHPIRTAIKRKKSPGHPIRWGTEARHNARSPGQVHRSPRKVHRPPVEVHRSPVEVDRSRRWKMRSPEPVDRSPLERAVGATSAENPRRAAHPRVTAVAKSTCLRPTRRSHRQRSELRLHGLPAEDRREEELPASAKATADKFRVACHRSSRGVGNRERRLVSRLGIVHVWRARRAKPTCLKPRRRNPRRPSESRTGDG